MTPRDDDGGYDDPYHGRAFADRDLAALVELSSRLSARYRGDPTMESEPIARHAKWWTMGVGVISVMAQVGGWLWWGGGFEQRVSALELQAKDAKSDIALMAGDNGRQNVTLGIIGQQYGEISRRLDGIERKLDKPPR